MPLATTIGLIAGTLTTVPFVPQVIKVWKTKKARDISLAMFAILLLGTVSWLTYGLLINNTPIILANGVTLVLVSTIAYFKIRYRQ